VALWIPVYQRESLATRGAAYEDTPPLPLEIFNGTRFERPGDAPNRTPRSALRAYDLGALAPRLPRRLVGKEGGVFVGALQSEREEETRDRAERGSAVRGFGCPLSASVRAGKASVAPKRIPPDWPARSGL